MKELNDIVTCFWCGSKWSIQKDQIKWQPSPMDDRGLGVVCPKCYKINQY